MHLTVGIPPKMRVNGNLSSTMDYPKMLPADTLEVLVNIMTEVQRERFEERGEYDMSFSIPNCGRYRVNAYKQRGSVALAFRLVGTVVPSPEELGVPESVVDLYQRKRGLVLVTGPTGSGKSTTLAAIIDKINNNRDAHVITLEDPIEYLHQHKMSMVNQREIGIDSNNYANALRAALREDPDVILVGEMRDFETISVSNHGSGNRTSGIVHIAYHRCRQYRRPCHRCIPAPSAATDQSTAVQYPGSRSLSAADSLPRTVSTVWQRLRSCMPTMRSVT